MFDRIFPRKRINESIYIFTMSTYLYNYIHYAVYFNNNNNNSNNNSNIYIYKYAVHALY